MPLKDLKLAIPLHCPNFLYTSHISHYSEDIRFSLCNGEFAWCFQRAPDRVVEKECGDVITWFFPRASLPPRALPATLPRAVRVAWSSNESRGQMVHVTWFCWRRAPTTQGRWRWKWRSVRDSPCAQHRARHSFQRTSTATIVQAAALRKTIRSTLESLRNSSVCRSTYGRLKITLKRSSTPTRITR